MTGTDKASGLFVPIKKAFKVGAGVSDGNQPFITVDQPESAPAVMDRVVVRLGQLGKRPDIDHRPEGSGFFPWKAEPFHHIEEL